MSKKTIDTEELKYILYTLDWIKILDTAIKMRKTSWDKDPVIEWRNAGDTICFSVVSALENIGVLKTRKEEIQDFVKHQAEIEKLLESKKDEKTD